LLTANNTSATISFNYDAADRMLSENLNGKITTYSYNVAARKRFITYPGGRMIEEDYDTRAQADRLIGRCYFNRRFFI
jgi:YD repeat-containing protein